MHNVPLEKEQRMEGGEKLTHRVFPDPFAMSQLTASGAHPAQQLQLR